MTAQASLFDPPPWRRYGTPRVRPPLARPNDPSTSHAAAIRAAGEVEPQRAMIHAYLLGVGPHGATAREIAAALGWTMEQVDRRMAELRDAAYVSTCNGKDGPGCLPLERRDGCAVHIARVYA